MISAKTLAISLIIFVSTTFSPPTGAQKQPSYRLDDDAQHQQPGHYAFEMAPQMVPPEVRKPPYPPSAQFCPGSDIFGGFSPKDTLCGDLNQGRVPLNPMGQTVHDQSYPFELIKNKTLQFLARALPVLKLDYESIPKMARFLPQQQQQQQHHLLNPTHQASQLSQEQMELLNQRLASAYLSGADYLSPSSPAYFKRRRRRKRSTASATSSRSSPGFMVAELSPNATLVVSSAHSAPAAGRIRVADADLADGPHHHQGPHHLAVITKNGYKSVSTPGVGSGGQRQAWNAAGKANSMAGLAKGGDGNNGQGDTAATTAISARQQQQVYDANAPTTKLQPTDVVSSPQGDVQGRSSGDLQSAAQQSASPATSPASTSSSSSPARQQQQQQASRGLRRMACSESGNGFTSAICQAAATLIEGERQPSWLQVMRQLGAAYSGASDQSSGSGASILSLVSGLMQAVNGPEPGAERSSSKSGHLVSNGPLSQGQRLLSLLAPLTTLLTSSARSDISSPKKESAEKAALVAQNKGDGHQAQGGGGQLASSLATIGSSTMTKLALVGWASNAVASLVEYFVPSLFSSFTGAAARSFARRKKPFDPLETFVDTPASSGMSMLSKRGDNPALQEHQSPVVGRQPPTPCPSAEEYVSPTFARNYQGAWKYVVQIPHEGYFTQTIQRTSCLRQRCEFTEGVCHESPRWVSLLVAEIFYPNTVFEQQQQQQQHSQHQQVMMASPSDLLQAPASMATSPSTSSVVQQARPTAITGSPGVHLHQDPLQMTDSLSTYNHNLHSTLISAANDLGWDPTNAANMQHLANAYQLMQRQGQLIPSASAQSTLLSSPQVAPTTAAAVIYQQQPALESRSATGTALPQQEQQQLGNMPNDYIQQLAIQTLQQNPNMNIQDLINSLNLAVQAGNKRKKRDTTQQQLRQRPVQQQQQQQYIQQRSSQPPEAMSSINDINSQVPHQQQQQQQQHQQQQQQQQQQVPQQQGSGGQQFQQQYKAMASVTQTDHQPAGGHQLPANQAHEQQPQAQQPQVNPSSQDQVECDGHDKLGCYVVRVYYDWFLVNGSCKCWKTGSSNGQQPNNNNNGQSRGAGGAGNSFLRRIFTG